MWTLRSGVIDPVTRNLDDLYREYFEEIASKVKNIGPFEPNEDRASVDVRFKGLSPEALSAFDLVESFYGSPTGKETLDDLAHIRKETRAAKRAFVEACYQEVIGLVDNDGAPIFSTVDVIEEFGLLDMLCRLGRWWHSIPSARKKRCGRPAQSTLATTSSIAQSAHLEDKDN